MVERYVYFFKNVILYTSGLKILHLSIIIGIPVAVVILAGALFYGIDEPTCLVGTPQHGTSVVSINFNSGNVGHMYFLMTPNCKAQLFVNYSFVVHSFPQFSPDSIVYDGKTGNTIPWWVFAAKAKTDTFQGNGTVIVTYTITSHGKGVYWLDLGLCDFIPIVVGIDKDQITQSDLQPVMDRWKCPPFDVHPQIINSIGMSQVYVEPTK